MRTFWKNAVVTVFIMLLGVTIALYTVARHTPILGLSYPIGRAVGVVVLFPAVLAELEIYLGIRYFLRPSDREVPKPQIMGVNIFLGGVVLALLVGAYLDTVLELSYGGDRCFLYIGEAVALMGITHLVDAVCGISRYLQFAQEKKPVQIVWCIGKLMLALLLTLAGAGYTVMAALIVGVS